MRRKLFFLAILLVLGFGAYLRLWGLSGRPFWRDEAWVAMLVERASWGDFFRQVELPVPPLLGVAAKLLNAWVSPPELAMRLPAALAGIALLPLSYVAARRLRAPRSVALAGMALCTCSMMLVVWSRELKQYELEACLAVLLAVLVFRLRRRPAGPGRLPAAAGIVFVCLVGPWLGYGTVFPAGALVGMLVVLPSSSGEHGRLGGRPLPGRPLPGRPVPGRSLLMVGLVGLVTLVLSTWLVLHLVASTQASNEGLLDYMRHWFIEPARLRSWLRAGAYAVAAMYWMLFPDNWTIRVLWQAAAALPVGLLALLGLICWPRRARAELLWWTVVPWLLLLAAAIGQRYPFGVARMMVFVVPPLLISVAMGLAVVCRFFALLIVQRPGAGLVVGVLVALLPSLYVVYLPTQYRYWVHHDFPPVLRVLAERHRPGEPVLVELNSVHCVRYYAGDLDGPLCYPPTAAGTLPVPGYDYDGQAREVMRRAGGRWWLLTTSEIEGRRAGLVRIGHAEGYRFELVAEAGNDGPYGKAQLLAAERR